MKTLCLFFYQVHLGYTVYMRDAGFEEIDHTADWALRVWAPDIPGLLEQAALGMYELSGIVTAKAPRQTRSFQLETEDAEVLVVDFLSELLYLVESQGLAFDRFSIEMGRGSLQADLEGAEIIEHKKEIKAVTFHNLSVERKDTRFEAEIVFDV